MPVELFKYDETVIKPPEWIVRDLIPKGHMCVLLAQSGAGKSFLAEAVAMHIAFGIPFCDMETIEGDVLIIDQDTPTDILKERLIKIGRGFGVPPKYDIHTASMMDLTLSNRKFAETINKYKAVFTVIDSLHSVCGKLNSNYTTDMSIWAKIKSQCLNGNGSIFVSHHLTEKISMNISQLMDKEHHLSGMGSSAIKQQADSEYILASSTNDNKIDQIFLRPIAKRQAIPQKPVIIGMVEDKDSIRFEFRGYYEEQTSEVESDILLLMTETKEEFTVRELRDRMGCKWGEKSLREALSGLEVRKLLAMRRNRSNLFKYRLP